MDKDDKDYDSDQKEKKRGVFGTLKRLSLRTLRGNKNEESSSPSHEPDKDHESPKADSNSKQKNSSLRRSLRLHKSPSDLGPEPKKEDQVSYP
jgi:hypothetical protein